MTDHPASPTEHHPRARELGIQIGRFEPGAWNAVTDVAGVRVGHTTLIAGDGPLVVGRGPVRTGVTVISPHEGNIGADPVYAGSHVLNGNGEMTGLLWIQEAGKLTTPIALTNTHSLGVVRDALISYDLRHGSSLDASWSLQVVAETFDGVLSDINGMHARPEHVWAALERATTGPVAEGCVGGSAAPPCSHHRRRARSSHYRHGCTLAAPAMPAAGEPPRKRLLTRCVPLRRRPALTATLGMRCRWTG